MRNPCVFYGVVFHKNDGINSGIRGFYTQVDTVFTVSSTHPSGTLGVTTFELSRSGSTLTFKLNGSSIRTLTQSGNVTRTTIDMHNVGSGASGSPTYVVNDFNFEKPIGTPYIT